MWETLIHEWIVDALHTLQKQYKMKTRPGLNDAFWPHWPLLVNEGTS